MIRHQIRDVIRYDLPVGGVVCAVTLLLYLLLVAVCPVAEGAEFVVVADKTAPAVVPGRFVVVVDNTTATDPDVPTDLTKPAPPGWEKVSVDGGPWHFRRVTTAAPGVAARTFRDPHACPTCGRFQYTVDRFNAGGTHSHRCPVDGSVWSH